MTPSPKMDDSGLTNAELLSTTDGQVWAKEFCRIFAKLYGGFELDEGWIIGWFANAIETGRSAGLSALRQDSSGGVELEAWRQHGKDEGYLIGYFENGLGPYVFKMDAAPQESRSEVLEELARAIVKFPTWPTDPLHAVSVIGEEYGELVKAVLQFTYEPHKSSREDVRTEAIQTAAMALRFVDSLDRYEYMPGPQHQQAALTSRAEPGAQLREKVAGWLDEGLNKFDAEQAPEPSVDYAPPALSDEAEEMWLIWSNEHDAWWGPGRCGYQRDLAKAGRYSFDEAREICRQRHWEDRKPPEVMICESDLPPQKGST